MKKETIKTAINIINNAIDHGVSLNDSCRMMGLNRGYVKTVKMRLKYEPENEITKNFSEIYNEYENKSRTNSPAIIPDTVIQTSKNKESVNFVENNNEATLTWVYSADHIKTLDELLKATDVDLNVWEVKDYTVNKWDVTSWKNNKPEVAQNFQVKARLIKKVEDVRERILGEIFREEIKGYKAPIVGGLQLTPKTSDNILEIALFDLHLGKLAWGKESGENYDSKIACDRFINTIKELFALTSGFSYSKILFPIGSDFFNSDTIDNTTTGGTQQDEDLRWKKTFRIGTRLIIDAISYMKLQKNVPIDVIVIPGNHDFQRSYYLGEYLSAWFKDDKNIHINNGPEPRKYYRFGKVLLGYTHGSEEKEGSLPMLMASDKDSKKHWTDTVFHEWHLGHIHRKRDVVFKPSKKTTSEELGVIVRYLSSLTGTEEWHFKKGFVGAIKAGEGFIWNKNSGMVAHLNANLIIE